jgi:hypothetical protein
MLLALLLAQLQLQPASPEGPIVTNPALLSGAAFEAFPSSGRGTKGVCSTTNPTGAKGEAISCPRASTATCTKTATGGLATTGIANGDLVVLSSNVCRVEYDSGGVLGLLTEITRTNTALRSQELDNAVWTTTVSGVAAPTITANFATAPDGTTTAERIQFPATTGGQYSLVQQAAVFSAGAVSACMYLRGNGTSGQICLSPGSSNGVSCLCPYVSTGWNLCKCENKTLAAGDFLYIGNYSGAGTGGACTGVSFGAADVLDFVIV